jgi:hypothetical protein
MPDGQLHANELELALLERVLEENPQAGFAIPDLRIHKRELTGVGSFTYFKVQGRSRVLPRKVLTASASVMIPGLQHGLGFVVFLEGNQLTLETYSFAGEKWDGQIQSFVIERRA